MHMYIYVYVKSLISCTLSCNTSCVILGNYFKRCIESIMKLSILRKYMITGGFRNAHAFTNWIKSDFPSVGLLLINLVCFFFFFFICNYFRLQWVFLFVAHIAPLDSNTISTAATDSMFFSLYANKSEHRATGDV